MTRESDAEKVELARRIQRELSMHGGKYTRMGGREDNSARVLELTESDIFAMGQRLKAILDDGVDPGDPRYACWTIGCVKHQSHSGDHDVREARDEVAPAAGIPSTAVYAMPPDSDGHEHRPVQHRDGKPPWCRECGLTADFKMPVSRIGGGRG